MNHVTKDFNKYELKCKSFFWDNGYEDAATYIRRKEDGYVIGLDLSVKHFNDDADCEKYMTWPPVAGQINSKQMGW